MADIYVIGYPKVGTTWLSRLLGGVLNSPVGNIYPPASNKDVATEGEHRSGPHRIGHGHPVPSYEPEHTIHSDHLRINLAAWNGEHIILMDRDPRDVAVSAWHHWRIESLDRTIECMIRGLWPMIHGGGYRQFYELWDKVTIPQYHKVRYEDLHVRPAGEIERILNKLEINPQRVVSDVVRRQSFAVRKEWTERHGNELNYGRDFQLNFLRRGIVGDWKNHFTKEQLDRIAPLL